MERRGEDRGQLDGHVLLVPDSTPVTEVAEGGFQVSIKRQGKMKVPILMRPHCNAEQLTYLQAGH